METFEYKTFAIDCKDMEHSWDTLTTRLNHWGQEGWELVSSGISLKALFSTSI